MEIITSHINADFDCLASMMLAKKLYPSALLVFSGSQDRNVRSFLRENPGVVEATRIRTVRRTQITRLIIVDTRQRIRIGEFADLIKSDVEIHVYDHHQDSPDDLVAAHRVIAEVGATATLLIELLQQNHIPLTPLEATIGLIGIYEDTGSLTFQSTTPRDLRAAAYLLECGGNLAGIAPYIQRELRIGDVKLLNDLVKNTSQHDIKGVKIIISTLVLKKYQDEIAMLVHKLVDMENISVFFGLILLESSVLLVARSRLAEVNVGEVAREFGGGGHTTAASATIRDQTLPEVKERLLKYLKTLVKPTRTANRYMTTHLKTVLASATLAKAAEIMDHYNSNALPVERDDVLVGIISRQVVDKAVRHGLGSQFVEHYMATDVYHVEPETPMKDVLQLMVEKRMHFLPVVKDRKVEGIITRIDVLRAFHHETQSTTGVAEGIMGEERAFERSVHHLLDQKKEQPLRTIIEQAGTVADRLGFPVYLVGGFVRDLLLARDNLDIDFVVEGDGIVFATELAKALGGRAKPYVKFNTAVIILPDGLKIDVASARMEYYQRPAALPTVEPGSIKHDLARRDFTINTLAIQINAKEYGRLIDHFGGQQDLKMGVIRVLHGLSFIEDPTRAYRAVRFEQRFNFYLGKQTLNFLIAATDMEVFDKLSGNRLADELYLIFKERNPFRAIRRLDELGLLKYIHPRLKIENMAEDLFLELDEVLTWFKRQFPSSGLDFAWLYELALADRLTLEEAEQMCQRLEFSQRRTERFVTHKRHATQIIALYRASEGDYTEVYLAMHTMELEPILLALAGMTKREIQQSVINYLTKLRQVQPEVKGRDLIELGLKPGPLFSQILQLLLRERLAGTIASKAEELKLIEQEFLQQQGCGRLERPRR